MQLEKVSILRLSSLVFLLYSPVLYSNECNRYCTEWEFNISSPFACHINPLFQLSSFFEEDPHQPSSVRSGLCLKMNQFFFQWTLPVGEFKGKNDHALILASYCIGEFFLIKKPVHTRLELVYQKTVWSGSIIPHNHIGLHIYSKHAATHFKAQHVQLRHTLGFEQLVTESISGKGSKDSSQAVTFSNSKPDFSAVGMLPHVGHTLVQSSRWSSSQVKHWIIDQQYVQELRCALQKLPVNQHIVMSFVSPRAVIERLRGVEQNPDEFLGMQRKYLYTRHTLFDCDLLIKELIGWKHLETIRTCENISIYMEKIAQNLLQEGEVDAIGSRGLPTRSLLHYSAKPRNLAGSVLCAGKPLFLNLGSGDDALKKLPGFNVDASPMGQPEFCMDARNLRPLIGKQFILIRASHLLEHFFPEEWVEVLRSWSNVLHPYGELHLAVPDAEITFQELEVGKTPKGLSAYSLWNTTAPLAQIYGVGYESPFTDTRWRHHVLFNKVLLEKVLKNAGYSEIHSLPKQRELALNCGVKDDAQNHYSLLLRARRRPLPHHPPVLLAPLELKQKIEHFKSKHFEDRSWIPLSILVPVRNEATILPDFLNMLHKMVTHRGLPYPVECIFIVNGSTDRSDIIIQSFLESQSQFPGRLEYSDPSILKAFIHGIAVRKYDGYIAKIDADTKPGYGALDLMYMFLFSNPGVKATYADPVPFGESDEVAFLEYHPELRSERRYLHGRCSMYPSDPFQWINLSAVLAAGCIVEDIAISYAFIMYLGFESIARTPHAITYHRPVQTIAELQAKLTRTALEIRRLEAQFPSLRAVTPLLRRTLDVEKLQMMEASLAPAIATYMNTDLSRLKALQVADWTRLPSTKCLENSIIWNQDEQLDA